MTVLFVIDVGGFPVSYKEETEFFSETNPGPLSLYGGRMNTCWEGRAVKGKDGEMKAGSCSGTQGRLSLNKGGD